MDKTTQAIINGNSPQAGVFMYLDCTTNHLTKETMELLEQGEDANLVATVAPYKYGVFVSVPSFDDPDEKHHETWPEDLIRVLRFADSLGCIVVRFDADAQAFPDDLPVYNW